MRSLHVKKSTRLENPCGFLDKVTGPSQMLNYMHASHRVEAVIVPREFVGLKIGTREVSPGRVILGRTVDVSRRVA